MMTRITLCFVLLICQQLTFGQTLLASVDVDLKNSREQHNAVTFANSNTNEVVVVASDKTQLHAFSLNSALFVMDSLTSIRPAEVYSFIAGHCFTGANPEIYWMTDDYASVFAVQLDFDKDITSTSAHTISYDNQSYVSHFSTDDAFYVVTVANGSANLHFYEFNSGRMAQHTVDLSATGLIKPTDKPTALRSLLADHALVKIDSNALTPLLYCTAKIKYYIENGKLRLTSDHQSHETIVVEIDLNDFSANHKKFAQPQLDKPGKSNSFLHGENLYQLKATDDRLIITISDFSTTNNISVFDNHNADIAMRNSPFLSQRANRAARILKTAPRFMRMLESSLPGISVYQTPDAKLLTIGGISYVASGGNILLGVAAGVGMVLSGSDMYIDELIPNDNLRTVFYETHLDSDMQYVKMEQQVLAADKMSMFFDQQKGASLISTIAYRDYIICSYYLDKDNQYVLRKFSDRED